MRNSAYRKQMRELKEKRRRYIFEQAGDHMAKAVEHMKQARELTALYPDYDPIRHKDYAQTVRELSEGAHYLKTGELPRPSSVALSFLDLLCVAFADSHKRTSQR